MELKAIISTILFILPGVLAYNWSEYVSNTSNKNKSNIEKIVMILCFTIPAVSFSLLILNTWFNYEINGLTALSKAADDIQFLLIYFVINLIIVYFVAEVWVLFLRKLMNKFINYNRGSTGLTTRQIVSVWEEAFDSEGTKVVFICPLSDPVNGQWGILKTVSLTEERDREFILIGSSVIEKVKHEFTEPRLTYIDSKTSTVVKIFDIEINKIQEEYHNQGHQLNNGETQEEEKH
ncbi:hypothetical protein [Bacillus sp. FJAT-45037]|uniref:hypothetical protein n=1 Tax=Bacillus sp. FJAT-45037 TaxID=2011007 RepID=UPI000C238AFB|nr:hypothetical protein [Bacillus sp. FJAT-45037]